MTFARGETSLILAVVTLIVMVLLGLITTCGAFARNVRQDRAPTRSFREFLNGEVDVETDRISGRVAEARHVRASTELCGVDSQSWPGRSKASLQRLSKV